MRADSEKDFVLQLGKVSTVDHLSSVCFHDDNLFILHLCVQTTEDCFNMDYRYPLSLLQAFAICIARYVF